MKAEQILQSNFLDILFENRNKAYGAYDLRRTYPQRIKRAILGLLAIVTIVTIVAVQLDGAKKLLSVITFTEDPAYSQIAADHPRQPEPPARPASAPASSSGGTPTVVADPIATQPISDNPGGDTDGPPGDALSIPGPAGPPGPPAAPAPQAIPPIAPVAPVDNPDSLHATVDVEASYPGGLGAWGKYLQKNLRGDVPVEANAPQGKYRVIVRFVVDKDGTISDIKAETENGFGVEEEAMRVIRKANKWQPALVNGRAVKSLKRQPVVFDVSGNE